VIRERVKAGLRRARATAPGPLVDKPSHLGPPGPMTPRWKPRALAARTVAPPVPVADSRAAATWLRAPNRRIRSGAPFCHT